ncbi:MAG: SDR family oxidoreductase [Alphaproteobacteria bacterium]|nr:SDR family oxidoreductase [Alphaproteobacteria bacterium]
MTRKSSKSDSSTQTAAAEPQKGRLAGKTAVITGAAGNLGGEIARRFAREGARVVMAGRTRERIEAARDAVVADTGVPSARIVTSVFDGGAPETVRAAMAELKEQYGRVDILINNAGSAGPKQPIDNVPLTREEMEACGDSETVADAMRNILGVTWNTARIAAPYMPVGGAMVNVSTIFSHARYYGRSPYVVPKAALNALSKQLSTELGQRGIRVNNIFPGPIESERIRTVFAAMDKLQGLEDGATAAYFLGRMSLKRAVDGRPRDDTLPTPKDIANACVFLGSEESAALNGVEIDVTHGMNIKKDDHSTYMTRPTMRSFDGDGMRVLILAGEDWADALDMAQIQIDAGAKVLLGMTRQADVDQARARTKAMAVGDRLSIARFNRSEPDAMEAALAEYTAKHGPLSSAIVAPVKPPNHYVGSLLQADDATVNEFMDVELVGSLAIARTLARYWRTREDLIKTPRIVYMSNPSDGGKETYNDVLAAGVEQLIRIWRNEAETNVSLGLQKWPVWGNQIIRYTNREEENTRFAAGHATRIVFKDQRIEEISLRLPSNIGVGTGARKATSGAADNIAGLHLGKVAFITGGSAGIGGQVARLLALAGARVMMVARRESELEAARERIVDELQDIGIAGVERRVRIMADVDVNDFASLKKAYDATIKEFGRVDYLINNAGVAGAEDMVVDMDPEAWRFTLNANLVSNYFLMHEAAPLMRKQGSGYVLNVSSYFGGEKFLAVAYPNRADYAVSKAGQRAMVEAFSQYLGPEIQCNAIAPGPVAGDRLAGTGGKPGLFQRRARLILENKRLNAVYASVIKAVRAGAAVDQVLNRLSRNSISALSHDSNAPEGLRRLALDFAKQGDGVCTWDQYVLTRPLAARLMSRLRLGGYLMASPDHRDAPAERDDDGKWLRAEPPADQPFLPEGVIEQEAEKVRGGVLSQLHLGAMPSEAEVAQATVFFLADRAVSGETFMPSGGLRVERSTTEREMFGSPKSERLEQMRGKTVWILGEHLADYIAEAVKTLVEDCGAGRVVVIPRGKKGGAAILEQLGDCPTDAVEILPSGADLEGAMDQALAKWGRPTTVVSMPYEPLPDRLFGEEETLSPDEFGALVEENLTQHFRVTRKASLYDECQIVLVAPDVPYGTNGPAFALANFIKTTLHAFTATVAVENERLVHDSPVNQINLTRRVRSEEPRNEAEHQEELKRFARAVLLVGAPLPDAQDSRYRARIYRGTSMTV